MLVGRLLAALLEQVLDALVDVGLDKNDVVNDNPGEIRDQVLPSILAFQWL